MATSNPTSPTTPSYLAQSRYDEDNDCPISVGASDSDEDDPQTVNRRNQLFNPSNISTMKSPSTPTTNRDNNSFNISTISTNPDRHIQSSVDASPSTTPSTGPQLSTFSQATDVNAPPSLIPSKTPVVIPGNYRPTFDHYFLAIDPDFPLQVAFPAGTSLNPSLYNPHDFKLN
jgi:hypothetical protein